MDDQRNKLLLQLTGQEFIDLLREGLSLNASGYTEEGTMEEKKHYVYGLKGICDLFECSTATAARIKKSGVLDPAISQIGNIIIIDADLAVDLIKVRKPKLKRR